MATGSTTKPRLERLARNRSEGGVITFTTLGYPDRKTCLESIKGMIEGGAAALELGIAFSDPVCDGPVIQKAAHEVIASGFKTADAFSLIEEIRTIDDEIPIILLLYYNTILARGAERFFTEASASGVDAVMIVDLPVESIEEVESSVKQAGLSQVLIASPLSSDERLDKIARHAGGFIYLVSRAGVTGVEERYSQTLEGCIERIKSRTKLPVFVGFGISEPSQAAKMRSMGADGVVIGSRIIQMVEGNRQHCRQEVKTFVASMAGA